MTTIATFLGFFNVCAGLMFVAAFLTFIGGFIRYLVVLGTERRNSGLATMYWGITILFVLVVLLGIVNTLQGPLFFINGGAVALFIIFAILVVLSKPKPPEPEHKA
jgi:hypothetical protein